MKLIIEGAPKEFAALVLAVQERHHMISIKKFAAELEKAIQIDTVSHKP